MKACVHRARHEETVKTIYVVGSKPLPNVAQVVTEVMRTPNRPDLMGRQVCIGVRGPEGAIYRHFMTDSLQEFTDAINALQGVRLVVEAQASPEPPEYCDATFRVKQSAVARRPVCRLASGAPTRRIKAMALHELSLNH
jgi:hypothetical protein